jgi:LacI family repressor for deo operon, udp, cdd, tsx, nupC, and nupG
VSTLREVAKYAAVSTATVSRVLSNTSYVSQATRARVLKAIEELGYTPHLAARALSKGRTYIVGVIFPYNQDLLFYDPFMLTVIQGIETVCTERNYNLLLNTPRVPVGQAEQFHRLMRSGYLDGAITFETMPGEPAHNLVRQRGYPCVSIGSTVPEYTLPNSVNVDDFSGARAMAAYLIAQGHRRFGVVGVDPAHLISAVRRMEGYRVAFEDAGLDFDAVPKVNGAFSVQSGYDAADRLLQLDRPSAILCMNDRMAMGVIQHLHAEGLSVPGDITVVGFDDIPGAEYNNPPLTTVRQPANAMGSTAANMLFDLIDAKCEQEFAPVIFQPELVIRASAAVPKGGEV